MRRHHPRTRVTSCRRGQALVEFAMVVPLLLMLLLGVYEFARAWNVYEVLTDAAREGARRAVVDDGTVTEDQVKSAIIAAGQRAAITISTDRITVTDFHTGRGNETVVRVEYDYELDWVGAFIGLATGSRTITMVSTFAMRQE